MGSGRPACEDGTEWQAGRRPYSPARRGAWTAHPDPMVPNIPL